MSWELRQSKFLDWGAHTLGPAGKVGVQPADVVGTPWGERPEDSVFAAITQVQVWYSPVAAAPGAGSALQVDGPCPPVIRRAGVGKGGTAALQDGVMGGGQRALATGGLGRPRVLRAHTLGKSQNQGHRQCSGQPGRALLEKNLLSTRLVWSNVSRLI